MSSNTCNYIDYGRGDHKRQTRAAYGRSSKAKVCECRLSLQPIGYLLTLWRTAPLQLQLPLVALYKCYAFFTFTCGGTLVQCQGHTGQRHFGNEWHVGWLDNRYWKLSHSWRHPQLLLCKLFSRISKMFANNWPTKDHYSSCFKTQCTDVQWMEQHTAQAIIRVSFLQLVFDCWQLFAYDTSKMLCRRLNFVKESMTMTQSTCLNNCRTHTGPACRLLPGACTGTR